MDSLLIYGSYGYTGRLIAREAVARGGSPALAGRNGRAVAAQADELGVEGRTFDLESADIASHLATFDAVLNCAGPFVETAEPLVEACLETDTDYLDITGEFPVFECLRQRDPAARAAGITLLPGVGFDVVPSDCLAAFLAEQLPDADRLALGIKGGGGISRGTARTIVEHLGGGVVRRNGRLIQVPTAFRTREVDFGDGPEHVVTVPWGDVVTAAHSTGIESVEVYAAAPSWATSALSAVDSLEWLLESRPVEGLLQRLIDVRLDGPDEQQLATGSAVVWGEVRDEAGDRRARARLRTPNPYTLTIESAVTAAERVLEGDDGIPVGFQTPASAFGSEFALELTGIERELVEAPPESDEANPSAVGSDD